MAHPASNAGDDGADQAVADHEPFTRRVWVVVRVVTFVGVGFWLLLTAGEVVLALFAGVLAAILFDGLAQLVERHTRLSHALAFTLVLFVLVAAAVGIGWLVGPQLVAQIDEVAEAVPSGLARLQERLQEYRWGRTLLRSLTRSSLDGMSWQTLGRMGTVLTGFAGMLVYATVILLIGVYGAAAPQLYLRSALLLIPRTRRERAQEVLHTLAHVMRRWFAGRIASMTVIGTLTWVGLWLMDVPVALGLGLLAGMLSFIPNVGPLLSVIPAVLIGLTQSPMMAVWVLTLYIGVQIVESYFATPFIEQRAVSLPPAFLLAVQLLLGVLFGLIGLFVATPLAVAVIVLVQMLHVQDRLGEDIAPLGTNHHRFSLRRLFGRRSRQATT